MRCLLTAALLMTCTVASAQDDPAQTAARRRALGGTKPFGAVVPRSNEPSGELAVLRIWPDRVAERIAVAALQGIVNRDRPKLYIGIDKPLRWLEYYGGKVVIDIQPDLFAVFDRFKDSVKGMVVYDLSLDALANVAITYAGIEDLIPADPDLAQKLSARYGWKVVHDLRGRWKTRIEAYRWAFENLFGKCGKSALTHYNHGYRRKGEDPSGPGSEVGNTGFMVDYSVEFRCFCWHVPREPSAEEKTLAEEIMQSVPFHTPIFGRSSSQDTFPEPAFVAWVAEFANLHIPAGMGNTSVLSGARLPEELLRQTQRPVRDCGPDKVYLAFTSSEKDNLEHVIGGGTPWHRLGMETDDPYKIWWSDPWRGRVPIGWPIGPLVAELAPTTLAHFTTTATENDLLMAALSGLCLSEPGSYGAAYPDIQDELLDEYCTMTGDYMSKLGWTQLQPVGSPGILRHFVKCVPNLKGMLEGYGMHKGITPEKADYMLDGVPVFHALTEGTTGTSRNRPLGQENPRKAKQLAEEIKSIRIAERPAFIHVWTSGWDFGPTTLKLAADLLPADYVVVRPDELAALFVKYDGGKPAASAAQITPQGNLTETPNGDEGLIVDTGKARFEIGWGPKVQPPIKRVMGPDGEWRGQGMLDLNNPRRLTTQSFKAEKTTDTPGERVYVLTYSYGEGRHMTFTIRAVAGRPYLIVKQQSRTMDLPSWGFSPYSGFAPDTLRTDAGDRTLDYKSRKSMGALPWFRWMFACRSGPPDRDLVGIIAMHWENWTNGEVLFWQHAPGGYWEFFHARTGERTFAIAALEKTDAEAPVRLWKELNGL